MQYQLYYEEGGRRVNVRAFHAATRKEAFAIVHPLNRQYKGWRSYFFEEIPGQSKPVIKRTVAV